MFQTKYGPWALVIGASEGLGAEFARKLASENLNLVLVARRQNALEELSRELEKSSAIQTRCIALDMTKRDQQSLLLEKIDDLDVGLLVCNAAVSPIGPFLEIPLCTHEDLIELNCHAAALLSYALGQKMTQRRRGGIILVTSMAGMQGTAQCVHYAASKAYLRILAEGLWTELRKQGVDVLACCAGQIRTPAFIKSDPRHPAWLVVPVMEPAAVVSRTLDALGKKTMVIPGWSNQLASFLFQRLFPRRLAIELFSATTRAMYPPRGPNS